MNDKKNNNFSLNKLLYNKKVILPFSVFLAIIVWVAISITQTPIREQTINDVPVTISTQNTVVSELGLDIIGEYTNKVSVLVSGQYYIVNPLTAKDLKVTVSLSNVTAAGTYTFSLTASKNSSKTGYEIISVTPANITLSFDAIDTKEFTVVAVANGVSATTGLIAESPVVTDSNNTTIQIKGPRTEIADISTVQAVANVNKTLSATESFSAKIVLIDKDGKEIDQTQFTIETDTIKISVPISKKKDVLVKTVFQNAPDIYKTDQINCTLSENTITIVGPPETVDAIDSIPLAPIDFNNISPDSTSFDMALELPTAVKSVDNIKYITVVVNLDNMVTKQLNVFTFTTVNLTTGLNVSLPYSVKNVSICGPSTVVKKIVASDLYAEVDLSGKSEGEYTMPVTIKCKSSGEVWAVGEYNVILTVK